MLYQVACQQKMETQNQDPKKWITGRSAFDLNPLLSTGYMMKRSQDTGDSKTHQIPVAGELYMVDRWLECNE